MYPCVLVVIALSACGPRAPDASAEPDDPSDPVEEPMTDDSDLPDPPADEICNGIDDDGDGRIDEAGAIGEATWYLDEDGDGYAGYESVFGCDPGGGAQREPTDCNDWSALARPGAPSDGICGNGIGDCAGDVGCRYEGHYLLDDFVFDRIDGVEEEQHVGRAVATIGGDGEWSDIAVSTYQNPYSTIFVTQGYRGGPARVDAAIEVVSSDRYEIGVNLAAPGDVDGDGLADLLTSARATEISEVWILYAPQQSGELTTSGHLLDAGAGVWTRPTGGDFNDDGIADVVFVAIHGSENRTEVYLGGDALGSIGPYAAYSGEESASNAVGSFDDVSGDGRDDFGVGMPGSAQGGHARTGLVYVVTEMTSGLTTLPETAFAVVGSEFHESAGYTLSAAGDINGDGYGDVLIGGYTASDPDPITHRIFASLVLGPITGDHSLGDAEARFHGNDFVNAGVQGAHVTEAGDLDSDGFDDAAIGLPGDYLCDWRGCDTGAVRLWYGPLSGAISLDDGARLSGDSSGFGQALGGARVRGGDGLAIGATYNSVSELRAGTVFLFGGSLP